MTNIKIIISLLGFILIYTKVQSQGTLPIYTDYLSDNIYLVHPSAAGIGHDGKLRLTHRQQWTNNQESPSLQTLSLHNRISEKVGLGAIFFNDKNGYHSQLGIQATYAYHINFGRIEALNQISLAMSGSYIQNSIDQTGFTITDPIISQIIESDNYFNADFSLAYHNLDGFIYFTAKNILLNTKQPESNGYRNLNLRRYLLNLGYFFGLGNSFQIEPSALFQYLNNTNEMLIDINTKLYKTFETNKRVFFALSYRRSLENTPISEALNQITTIIGLEVNKFLFSYNFTQQIGNITFQNSGFHQITIGLKVFSKRERDRGYIPNYNPFMYKQSN